MLSINGELVLDGINPSHPFPGAMIVRLDPASLVETLVITKVSCGPIEHKCQITLRGYFLHSTLKGLRIFEAETVQTVSDPPLAAIQSQESRWFLSGVIDSISQCTKLQSGLACFVSISSEEIRGTCVVLLLSAAIHVHPYAQVGQQVQFIGPQRFRWKNDSNAQSSTQSTSISMVDASSLDFQTTQYFYVESADQVRLSEVPVGVAMDAPQLLAMGDEEQRISAEDLVTPQTMIDKDVLASTEFGCVVGVVNIVHPTGWLELHDAQVFRNAGGSSGEQLRRCGLGIPLPSCIVYMSHHLVQHLRVTAVGVSVRRGAEVCVSRVIPIYLWGRMKGLATSCRSNVRITQFAESKQFVSRDPTYCAVSMKAPAEIRNSCVLYAAWRVEMSRKLAQALGNRLLSTNDSLEERLVAAVEGGVMIPITAAPDGNAGGRGGRGGGDTAQKQSLRDAVRLTTPIPVQQELFDLNQVLLHTIRNGLDADWLGNNLPQLYTVSHFVHKLQTLHWAQQPHCEERLYTLSHYDVCAAPRSSSYWSQYNGRGSSRQAEKSVSFVGVVTRAVLVCSDRASGTWGAPESVLLTMEDAQGGAVRVVVQGVTPEFRRKLRTACDTVLTRRVRQHGAAGAEVECNRCKGWRPAPVLAAAGIAGAAQPGPGRSCLEEYRCDCGCAAGGAAAVDAVVLLVRQPQGLVEKVPATGPGPQQGGLRHYVCCDAANITILSTAAESSDASGEEDPPPPIATAGIIKSEPAQPIGVRELLNADMQGSRQRTVPALLAVVTQILLLEPWAEVGRQQPGGENGADYKEGNSNNNNHKKRKAEGPYSLYAESGARYTGRNSNSSNNSGSGSSNGEERKCCVTLRDLHYPDTINMYLSAAALGDATVGTVLLVTHAYAYLTESLKKLHLGPVDAHKPAIDPVGMVAGWQLRRLCALSVAQPGPRFVDVASIQWNTLSAAAASSSLSSAGVSLPFLQAPPRTTLRHLTGICAFSRVLWRVQCQVVFVRKIVVTLRCTKCYSFAKVVHRQCGYQCPKCQSSHTLRPLWETQLSLDDGTAECSAHIEGDGVFPFLRARYDVKGLVLQEIRVLVDEYVQQYSSLSYDAYEKQGFVEYNKPYEVVVGEQQRQEAQRRLARDQGTARGDSDKGSVASSAEAQPVDSSVAALMLERPGSNAVFDLPLSDIEKRLVPRYPLRQRPSSVKVGGLLKAYMQVGSCAHQYAILGRVDFSAAALASKPGGAATGKGGKREVKVQKNNAEKPYLAYFSLRPTHKDAKLAIQVLHASEIRGGALTAAAWDLLQTIHL